MKDKEIGKRKRGNGKPDFRFLWISDQIQELPNVAYEHLEKESSPGPSVASSRTGLDSNLTGIEALDS